MGGMLMEGKNQKKDIKLKKGRRQKGSAKVEHKYIKRNIFHDRKYIKLISFFFFFSFFLID